MITVNQLVPERPSLDVFRTFPEKWRSSPQLIFTMKLSKSPPLIFLSIMANLKTIEIIPYQWAAKNWSSIWPSKKFFLSFSYWDDLIVFMKTKNFFSKKSKKNFLGQIGLQFFGAQWSAFIYTVLRLAGFDRKINVGYFDSFIEKIRWEEHLNFYGKRRKTSRLGRSGTARILTMQAPMG